MHINLRTYQSLTMQIYDTECPKKQLPRSGPGTHITRPSFVTFWKSLLRRTQSHLQGQHLPHDLFLPVTTRLQSCFSPNSATLLPSQCVPKITNTQGCSQSASLQPFLITGGLSVLEPLPFPFVHMPLKQIWPPAVLPALWGGYLTLSQPQSSGLGRDKEDTNASFS